MINRPSISAAEGWRCGRWQSVAAGVQAGLGPALAGLILALSYGAAARARGWGIALPLLFSTLGWSSSAQFTLLYALGPGSAVPAIAAAVLINARYLVMSVALNTSLRGRRLRGALQSQALADASFAIAHQGDGTYDIGKLIGASLPQWVSWVLGTAAGVILAPTSTFIHTYGLDATLPAFFMVLTLEQMRRSPRSWIAGMLGGAITAAMLMRVAPGFALLTATSAAGIGLLPHPRTARAGEGLVH